MMTVKQVSSLTGVSIRTLQFYDEIGLLKPAQVTGAGYRLYDENTLETLQQILFFKELDFTLKEIKIIIKDPAFDKTAAFKKQRELIQIKRDRLDALLNLLDKLIKGEKYMDFNDFDMSRYFQVLSEYKETYASEIIKQFGSIEQFEALISRMKSQEAKIASLAIKQYGSVENYVNAMEKNLEKFLVNGPPFSQKEAKSLTEQTEELMARLTADLSKDPASLEVQELINEMISLANDSNKGMDMGENYWDMMAEMYLSHPAFMNATDKKYGNGASKFIGLALTASLNRQ